MNSQIEVNLSLILFFPWFAILGVLFLVYPRKPRTLQRLLFDTASLVLALVATVVAMQWSFYNADPTAGAIWKQVLATSIAYGFFLFVLMLAMFIRHLWLTARVVEPAAEPDA